MSDPVLQTIAFCMMVVFVAICVTIANVHTPEKARVMELCTQGFEDHAECAAAVYGRHSE